MAAAGPVVDPAAEVPAVATGLDPLTAVVAEAAGFEGTAAEAWGGRVT